MIIVVADSLNRYNYISKDNNLNEETASIKANEIGNQYFNHIKKIVQKNYNIQDIKLERWDNLVNQYEVQYIMTNLIKLSEISMSFLNDLNKLSHSHLTKNSLPINNYNLYNNNLYLIEEMSVSIYLTEILDYNIEIYPRGNIALLSEIYSNKYDSFDLKTILNKNITKRRFFNLEFIN